MNYGETGAEFSAIRRHLLWGLDFVADLPSGVVEEDPSEAEGWRSELSKVSILRWFQNHVHLN